VHEGFAFFGGFATVLFAGFGLAIEGLRDCGGAADVADTEHFYFEFSAFGADLQEFRRPDFTRRFYRLVVRFDSA
jgi:hypothetical protein